MGSPVTPYLQVVKGHVTYFSNFGDPLHIAGMVEAKNFQCGMQIDHEGNQQQQKCKI